MDGREWQVEWDAGDPHEDFRKLLESYKATSKRALQMDELPLRAEDEAFDLVYSSASTASEEDVLREAARVLAPDGVLAALAEGESHRIELQEIFGRGRNWPPPKPLRFAIPERLSAVGLELMSLSEYYGTSHCPDLESYAAELAGSTIIPDFDAERDAVLLREVARKLTTERGIRDTQHRVLFVARKP